MKKYYWLIIGVVAVLTSIYVFIFYKFADSPGLPIRSSNSSTVTSSSSTTEAINIKNLMELFAVLENKEHPPQLVNPANFWKEWQPVADISSGNGGIFMTEPTVSSDFTGKNKEDVFLVFHQSVIESTLKYYGPFKGNIPDLVKQIKALKKDQEIYPGLKIQAVEIKENFNKF